MEEIIEKLKLKLRIARRALFDISKWTDDLEDEWQDTGERANDALVKMRTDSLDELRSLLNE